jgi:HEAT repeat protein
MEELVQQLVAGFAKNYLAYGRNLRELADRNWGDFTRACLTILAEGTDSQGTRFLVTLLTRDETLTGALSDPTLFSIKQAADIAKFALVVDPQFDLDLARPLTSSPPMDEALTERVLSILEAIGDSRRLRPFLVPLLTHASGRIRSKTALLIGRSIRNPELTEDQLSDQDVRVRANAVEALWGADDPACKSFLQEAARDPNARVAGNAVIGLYKLGDPSSILLLHDFAKRTDPAGQATAAWAMAETGNPRFRTELTRLVGSGDPRLRHHALRGLSGIRRATQVSQLAGTLTVLLWKQIATPDGRTVLAATVASNEKSHVPGLPLTEIVLLEGKEPVSDYSVVEHLAPPILVVGFAIPATLQSASLGLHECLAEKRFSDQWCLQRYTDTETSAPSVAAGRDSGQKRVQFTNHGGALARSIDETAPSEELPEGLGGAILSLAGANAAVSGPRHLICISGQSQIARAPTDGVIVHGIALPDSSDAAFLEELCQETGGGFYGISETDEIPAILKRIQTSLRHRYEIVFRPTNLDVQNFSLQIYSNHGYGEAKVITSPPTPD